MGSAISSATRAYAAPINAELHEMLWPAFEVGARVEQHGRTGSRGQSSRPARDARRRAARRARCGPPGTPAPVCPAVKTAPARRRWRPDSAATFTDARGLRRSAASGASSIAMASGASTTEIVDGMASRRRASSSRTTAVGADQRDGETEPRGRLQRAPATTAAGARSPPIASTATCDHADLPRRRRAPGGRGNTRSSGTPDAAA